MATIVVGGGCVATVVGGNVGNGVIGVWYGV